MGKKVRTVPPLWTPMYVRLGIATVLLSFVEQMITVNMSLYMEDLGASAMIIGVVMTVFTFASMIVRFLAGPLMDRYGRLKIGLFGLFLSLIPLLGYVLFPSVWVVILMRFIQGAGFSCASLSQGTMSVDIPAEERKDEGTGYYGLFYSVATLFGPAVGLAFSGSIGYTGLFGFCILVFVAEILIAYTLNYEKKRGIAYSKAGRKEKKMPLWERLIERTALPAALVTIFTSCAYVAVTSFMAVYARSVGVGGVGIFFAVVAVMTFLGRIVSGKMIARQKRVTALLLGNLLMGLGMVLLAGMDNMAQMLAGAVILGLGGGYAWPALAILAVTRAEPRRRGTANSTYYAAYDLGLSLGGLLGGMLAEAAGYRVLYGAGAAIFAFAAILTASVFGRELKREFLQSPGKMSKDMAEGNRT